MPQLIHSHNNLTQKIIKPFKRIALTSVMTMFIAASLSVSSVSAQENMIDKRTPIHLSDAQRNLLLSEMRELLEASQQILEGVVNNDLEQVEKAARAMGLSAAGGVPPAIGKLLPKGFKVLGPQVHKGYERIADEADGFGDKDKILKILSNTQKICTECHATFKF